MIDVFMLDTAVHQVFNCANREQTGSELSADTLNLGVHLYLAYSNALQIFNVV